jgi:hypothetical protein
VVRGTATPVDPPNTPPSQIRRSLQTIEVALESARRHTNALYQREKSTQFDPDTDETLHYLAAAEPTPTLAEAASAQAVEPAATWMDSIHAALLSARKHTQTLFDDCRLTDGSLVDSVHSPTRSDPDSAGQEIQAFDMGAITSPLDHQLFKRKRQPRQLEAVPFFSLEGQDADDVPPPAHGTNVDVSSENTVVDQSCRHSVADDDDESLRASEETLPVPILTDCDAQAAASSAHSSPAAAHEAETLEVVVWAVLSDIAGDLHRRGSIARPRPLAPTPHRRQQGFASTPRRRSRRPCQRPVTGSATCTAGSPSCETRCTASSSAC